MSCLQFNFIIYIITHLTFLISPWKQHVTHSHFFYYIQLFKIFEIKPNSLNMEQYLQKSFISFQMRYVCRISYKQIILQIILWMHAKVITMSMFPLLR